MSEIFEPTTINGMTLANRLARSATWEGLCEDDGRPTEEVIELYRALARGGVGLIISGFAFVRPDGKQLAGKMGIHTDNFAPDMKALTAAVHEEGGRVCLQMVHAGGQATTKAAGRQPLAPSAVKVPQFPEEPAAMTPQDIEEIVAAFGAGARRGKEYGFDAVQLHGAHGYLINQFLSPLTNTRTDGYGGSIENRCRFLLEVYHSVRAAVGKNYPVCIKLNGSDFLEGGLSESDALHAAQALDRGGIDMIEVSGGTPASGKRTPARAKIIERGQEAYHLPLAQSIKGVVSCPVMVVGGLRSYDLAEEIIQQGKADYISMARPFIREPGLPKRWRSGDTARAKCMSCNGCFISALKGKGLCCVMELKEEQKNK